MDSPEIARDMQVGDDSDNDFQFHLSQVDDLSSTLDPRTSLSNTGSPNFLKEHGAADETLSPLLPTSHKDAVSIMRQNFPEPFYTLFMGSVFWVAGGIIIMLTGIIFVYFVILSKIYECPDHAVCSSHLDMDSDVLQYLQAGMGYWLQLGSTVCGVGLVHVASYYSWFAMQEKGKDLVILQNNFRALEGGFLGAATLFRQKSNRILATITISQVVLTAAIPLVVSYSISKSGDAGLVKMKFRYADELYFLDTSRNGSIDIPNLSVQRLQFGILGLGGWDQKPCYNGWNCRPPNFKGTFVVPDNRTAMAVNAWPDGDRITGSVSCTGEGISIAEPEDKSNYDVDIIYPNYEQPGEIKTTQLQFRGPLEVRYIRNGTGRSNRKRMDIDSQLLWIALDFESIPNATRHGQYYIGICNHTISMVPIPQKSINVPQAHQQPIKHSLPAVDSESSMDLGDGSSTGNQRLLSALRAVDWFIYNHWWNRPDRNTTALSCVEGILAPFGRLPAGKICRMNGNTWENTTRAVLDTLVATVPRGGTTSQKLWVRTASVDRKRWWFQVVIPIATFLLYLGSLSFVSYRTKGRGALKGMTLLSLLETINETFNFTGKLTWKTSFGGRTSASS